MCDDPIVAEVRAIRQQIAAECDYDLHKLYLRACEVQKNWKGKVATKEDVAPGGRAVEATGARKPERSCSA